MHMLYRLVLLVLCSYGSCGALPLLADEVVDDRGVAIQPLSHSARVATVSAFGADVLLAFGMRPVGMTSFGPFNRPDFLGHALTGVPLIGSRGQLNLEVLSEISPDLILAIRRYTEKNAAQLEQIAPYMALDLVTLADSLRGVQLTGEVLGFSQLAATLNHTFEVALQEAKNKAPGGVSAALLVTSAETPFAYYDHFITAQLFNYLNVSNIAGASPTPDRRLPMGYRMPLEKLLEKDPDVIFLIASQKQRAFTLNPIWPYLSAVKNGRVYEVGQHWKEAAGPHARTLILAEMAHRIYPDLFPEPDLARSRPY